MVVLFEIDGIDRFSDKIKRFFQRKSMDSLWELAMVKTEDYAKRNCPVDTGYLRKSIFTVMLKEGFAIGASAYYAVYNEFGSIYSPAGEVDSPLPAKYSGFRPFLRPAIHKIMEEMPDLFRGEFYNTFK